MIYSMIVLKIILYYKSLYSCDLVTGCSKVDRARCFAIELDLLLYISLVLAVTLNLNSLETVMKKLKQVFIQNLRTDILFSCHWYATVLILWNSLCILMTVCTIKTINLRPSKRLSPHINSTKKKSFSRFSQDGTITSFNKLKDNALFLFCLERKNHMHALHLQITTEFFLYLLFYFLWPRYKWGFLFNDKWLFNMCTTFILWTQYIFLDLSKQRPLCRHHYFGSF